MEIKNRYSTNNFNGIVKNTAYRKARLYAISIGEKDKFKSIKKFCDNHDDIDLSIFAKKIKYQLKGNRIVVKVNSSNLAKRKEYDFLNKENIDLAENIYNVLKYITDPSTEIFYKIFR